MNFVIFLLVFSIIGSVECYPTDALIGDYNQFITNYELCGKSFKSIERSNKCFKYHPIISNPITSGKEAWEGQVPWVAFFEYYFGTFWKKWLYPGCSGTLITPEWVLTAVHCFINYDGEVFSVYFGIHFKDSSKRFTVSNKNNIIIHPHFNKSLTNTYDVALLKLDSTVVIKDNGNYYPINTICLPPDSMKIIHNQTAFSSGWGKGSDKRLNIALQSVLTYETWVKPYIMHHNGSRQSGYLCRGDSGGPLWQYVYGKAVIIGVITRGQIYPNGTCSDEGRSISIFVPKIVNWIIKTIRDN